MPAPTTERPLGRRLLWFAGLWLAGVASVGLVSLVLHFWIATK
jgi:hypothetical protein